MQVNTSSWTSIEDGIVTAYKTICTAKPILSYQNGVEPQYPYCFINLIKSSPIGQQSEHLITNTITREVQLTQDFEATVKFQFVGKDKQVTTVVDTAQNIAEAFTMKLRTAQARLAFADNALSVMRIGELKRIPKVKESDIFNVYTVDVIIGYTQYITTVYDTIDSVEMTGTFTENTTGDLIINIDLP